MPCRVVLVVISTLELQTENLLYTGIKDFDFPFVVSFKYNHKYCEVLEPRPLSSATLLARLIVNYSILCMAARVGIEDEPIN